MNPYGEKVKKEMESYMNKPNSVADEVNDIQNALEGSEVRGALAAGVQKSFDISKDAQARAGQTENSVDNIQQQVNQIVKIGDSSVEAAQARVDANNKTYDTLKQRLDEKETEFTSQLNETKEIISSRWKNKTGVALGDSITWQDGQPYGGVGEPAVGYLTLLKDEKGMANYFNYGQSGKSMSGSTSGDTNVIGKTIDYTNVDFVTIFAGTNDFKLNKYIGKIKEIGDPSFNTQYFTGAYQSLIEHILNEKPTIEIFLFTPLQRDNGGYSISTTNLVNHKLIDYVEAIKKIGALYSIPVIDLYSISGITINNLSTYTTDGLHLNDLGYKKITHVLSPFLENEGYANSSYQPYQKVYKGVVIFDSFNRSDTVYMGVPDISIDNEPWESVTGTGFNIANNVVVPTNTTLVIRVVDGEISDRCSVRVEFPVISENQRLYFRVQDSQNCLLVRINSAGVYELIELFGGSSTTLATGSTTANNNDIIKVELNGNKIDVFVNNVLEITGTSNNFLNMTKHGIGNTGTTSCSFDNFCIEAL